MAHWARRGLGVCAALVSVADAVGHGPSEENPLWEPDHLEYFGALASSEPKRFSNLSIEEFNVLGTNGVPLVVTDGCRDCPMKAWTCEEVSRMFAGVKFRQEYGRSDDNKVTFGTSDWVRQKTKIRRRVPLPPDAPQYAPFYSDLVKAWRSEPERAWGDKKAVLKMEKAIQQASKPYYFMHQRNAREMKRDPEFWLQPPETGSMAHMDEHCIPTIATTLSGVKRWRLAHIPEKPNPEGYFDGLAYDRGEWHPMFNFTTKPGESLIFPPGMIHEGLSVGDDCVSSITYQFVHPAPVGYWRSFWPRIRRTKDMRQCFHMVSRWATLNQRSYKALSFAKAKKKALEFAAEVDTDHDGFLSLQEIGVRFKRDTFGAEEAFRYHDVDGDGRVSLSEFATNLAAWSAVEHQAQKDNVVFHDENGPEAHGHGQDL